MVKALHKAGIEVILDVVFNHTGEGNHTGPTISFKGLDNGAYYLLDPTSSSTTWTTPAAATRVNCNHPVVAKFIVDCLRYWVRGDARRRLPLRPGAPSSRRGADGEPMDDPPVIWQHRADRRRSPTRR